MPTRFARCRAASAYLKPAGGRELASGGVSIQDESRPAAVSQPEDHPRCPRTGIGLGRRVLLACCKARAPD